MDVFQYLVRVAKISSTCFVYGNVVADLLYTKRDAQGYSMALMIASIVAFVAGLINLFVFYRPSKIFPADRKTFYLRLI